MIRDKSELLSPYVITAKLTFLIAEERSTKAGEIYSVNSRFAKRYDNYQEEW